MSNLRWWLFRRLSALGWWICPEPHKRNLQKVMPTWDDFEREVGRHLVAKGHSRNMPEPDWPHGKHCTIPRCPHCGANP